MLRNCRWCIELRNGAIAIEEHERRDHPREYGLAKISANEIRIKLLMMENDKLRSRYLKEANR